MIIMRSMATFISSGMKLTCSTKYPDHHKQRWLCHTKQKQLLESRMHACQARQTHMSLMDLTESADAHEYINENVI